MGNSTNGKNNNKKIIKIHRKNLTVKMILQMIAIVMMIMTKKIAIKVTQNNMKKLKAFLLPISTELSKTQENTDKKLMRINR